MADGFALVEYVVPKNSSPKISMGIMDKAPREKGSLFAQSTQKKVPGPEHYFKDSDKAFSSGAHGGGFSKVPRDFPNSHYVVPAVGKYDVDKGDVLTSPRTKGGKMASSSRGCAHIDRAVNCTRWKPSPGQYDANKSPRKVTVPSFTETTTPSKVPTKPSTIGPGHYDAKMDVTERSVPCYSGPRESSTSFLDKITKGADKLPAPGQFGIPESKHYDIGGRRMHSARILADRIISPRQQRPSL